MSPPRRRGPLSRENLRDELMEELKDIREQNEAGLKQGDANTQRILVMMSGDPKVTDPHSPDHYSNSTMGRLDAMGRRITDMESGLKTLREVDQARFEDLEKRVLEDSFGWTRVTEWLKRHWGKLGLLFLVLLLERRNIMELARDWFSGA